MEDYLKEKYLKALRRIDTHIRSTSESIPYIIKTLMCVLPEYNSPVNISVNYMFERSLQDIIKDAANRYGLEYDENQQVPMIKTKDGSIREISKEEWSKAFDIK